MISPEDQDTKQEAAYGIYDLDPDAGFAGVRINNETSPLAVSCIARWWETVGMQAFPDADRLLIAADGANKPDCLWNAELESFADRSYLELEVLCLPQGTCRGNKIEQRTFLFEVENRPDRPPRIEAAIVSLIGLPKEQGVKLKA